MKDNQKGMVGSANPAAVYCLELGYEYKVVDDPSGQKGVCVFPDGSECEIWAFLEGKCGQEYSYCEKCGYSIQTMNDGQDPFSREYAICVSKEGHRVGSITELMALSDKTTKASVRLEESTGEQAVKKTSSGSQIPPSFDWRDYQGQDWMTPVKDQGGCGSCWAFAPVGVMEAMYNIWQNNPDLDLDLSEEYLVSDCYSSGDCCGGSDYSILRSIYFDGMPDENCFPYVDGTGCTCSYYTCDDNCRYFEDRNCSDVICSDKCPDWQNRLIKINSASYLKYGGVLIKDYIANNGPIVVSMGMGGGDGYWDGDIYRCTNDSRYNHVVVIVGYDDEGGYWIIRNSYGVGFGDNGYFKLGYGECGVDSTTSGYHFLNQPECGCIVANNTILEQDLVNCRDGFTIEGDSVVVDCNGHLISGTGIGIWAMDRDAITIKNCNITGFGFGIALDRGSNSVLENNTLNGNRTGIEIFGSATSDPSSGNHIVGNLVSGSSKCGIRLYNSSYNSIRDNQLIENVRGISVENSSRFNTFWTNHFIANDVSALEDPTIINNYWNLGEAGNYWSDFESNPGYPDFYEIAGEGDGVDYYPRYTPNPREFLVAQNYPNPFNPSTTIEYSLPDDALVSLTIYNILGQKVRTLVNEYQSCGYKRIVWDSKDNDGNEVASGIYFYKIKAGEFTQSKKMVIPK